MPAESDLIWRVKEAALDVGLGRGYGHTEDNTTNCVRIWWAILTHAWMYGPDAGIDHKLWHLNFDGALGSYRNVLHLVELGLARRTDLGTDGDGLTEPDGVHVAQGWGKNSRGAWDGHCFGVVSPPLMDPRPEMVLEATNIGAEDDGYSPIDWAKKKSRYDHGIVVVRLVHPNLVRP